MGEWYFNTLEVPFLLKTNSSILLSNLNKYFVLICYYQHNPREIFVVKWRSMGFCVIQLFLKAVLWAVLLHLKVDCLNHFPGYQTVSSIIWKKSSGFTSKPRFLKSFDSASKGILRHTYKSEWDWRIAKKDLLKYVYELEMYWKSIGLRLLSHSIWQQNR